MADADKDDDDDGVEVGRRHGKGWRWLIRAPFLDASHLLTPPTPALTLAYFLLYSVHCQEVGCIRFYIPDDQETYITRPEGISRGLRGS